MDSSHDRHHRAAAPADQPPMPGQAELERLLDASEFAPSTVAADDVGDAFTAPG
jgi:hypothetical protein